MSLMAAIVLALLGALGTFWVMWLRREGEREADALAEDMGVLAAEVAGLRSALETTRGEVSALRGAIDGMRAELSMFVHGPPSLRRPPVGTAAGSPRDGQRERPREGRREGQDE